MDYSYLFLKMAVIGLIIAAPIGPVSLLFVQRTMSYGFPIGILCDLVIAAADAIFASIAVFGMVEVTELLINNKPYISFIGGTYLIYLGIKPFFVKKNQLNPLDTKKKKGNEIILFFGITITNPMTILTFAAA